jgi:hypothetical protein
MPTLPPTQNAADAAALAPLGLVVTEFHALLAYTNRVRGICLLNEQVKIVITILADFFGQSFLQLMLRLLFFQPNFKSPILSKNIFKL